MRSCRSSSIKPPARLSCNFSSTITALSTLIIGITRGIAMVYQTSSRGYPIGIHRRSERDLECNFGTTLSSCSGRTMSKRRFDAWA